MSIGSIVSTAFVRLWIGNTASGIATWALPFVLGLITLEGRLTAGELGLVLGVRTAGFLVAVPVAGVVADRVGPRRVIFLAGVAAAAGMALMTWGFGPAGRCMAAVLAGAIVAGIGQGACRPAFLAIVPLVVAADRLQSANAAMTLSVRVTTLLGPLAATGLAYAFGGGVALLLIALLWVTSALLPPGAISARVGIGCSGRAATVSVRGSFGHDMLDGIGEARRHPWFVAGLAALTCVIATGYSVTSVVLPVVSQAYHGGPALLTAAVTAYTLGALAGAVILTRWKPVNVGWSALCGLALYALAPFSLLAPFHIAVPVAAYFIAGIGIEIFNVPWFTSVQREVPPDRLSRVSSIDFLMSYGLAPLGLVTMAPAIDHFGQGAVLVASGLICLAAPLLAMLVPTTRLFSRRP